MTDIVERLRGRKAFGLVGGRWHMLPGNDTECAEAADEIERLRMALRINGLRWGHTHKEIDALIADQDNKP